MSAFSLSAAWTTYHGDVSHLRCAGSVRALSGASGQPISAHGYSPYGDPTTAAPDDFGYTGEQTGAGGLVYLRARYYDPGTGVFISHDPWAGDVMRPASLNGWSYVEGNPVRFADPSGACIDRQTGEIRWHEYPHGSSGLCQSRSGRTEMVRISTPTLSHSPTSSSKPTITTTPTRTALPLPTNTPCPTPTQTPGPARPLRPSVIHYAVRLFHGSDPGDGSRTGSHSLGVTVGNRTILTHNHYNQFGSLPPIEILTVYNQALGVVLDQPLENYPSSVTVGETKLLHTSSDLGLPSAPIASATTIAGITAGVWVDLIYFDDSISVITVSSFEVVGVSSAGDEIYLNDPLLGTVNSGDSGGGVFLGGQLIGNTRGYDDRGSPIVVALFPNSLLGYVK